MLAELLHVRHLKNPAITYSYTGLFDGPRDIGMLDLIALQTRHLDDVFEREHSCHLNLLAAMRQKLKMPDPRQALNTVLRKRVKVGGKGRKTRLAEGSRRKVKES